MIENQKSAGEHFYFGNIVAAVTLPKSEFASVRADQAAVSSSETPNTCDSNLGRPNFNDCRLSWDLEIANVIVIDSSTIKSNNIASDSKCNFSSCGL